MQDSTMGAEHTYVDLLSSYAKNRQIFICPSTPNAVSTFPPPATDHNDYSWEVNGQRGSYSMNVILENMQVNAVGQISLTPEFADSRVYKDIDYESHLQFCGRHFAGINISYVDGHVKWISLTNAAHLNFLP